jgi:predicted nucleotidyltransferase/Arc/MetJ-type ribon-helix-helix transcriptional regulator
MMAAKVMVSFPDEFLAEVDRVAQEEHRSRSELVREALRLYIGLRQDRGQPAVNARVRQAVAVQDNSPDVQPMREALGGTYRVLAAYDRRIACEFRRRLSEIAQVRDLRVFGSRARGNPAPDSDLDVFVELEEATPELREQVSEIAWEVGFEMDRVISTVVATREELEQGAMGANPLVLNVEREGVRP